jgi:hypothetical protein
MVTWYAIQLVTLRSGCGIVAEFAGEKNRWSLC